MGNLFSSPKAPDNSAQIESLQKQEAASAKKAEEASSKLTAEQRARSTKRRGLLSLIGTSEAGLGDTSTLG